MADFLANYDFSFAGTEIFNFSNFQQLPTGSKVIINMDKAQVLSMRIKKLQNKFQYQLIDKKRVKRIRYKIFKHFFGQILNISCQGKPNTNKKETVNKNKRNPQSI